MLIATKAQRHKGICLAADGGAQMRRFFAGAKMTQPRIKRIARIIGIWIIAGDGIYKNAEVGLWIKPTACILFFRFVRREYLRNQKSFEFEKTGSINSVLMHLNSIEKEALQKVKALIESHYQHHYSIAYLASIALMGRTKLVESFKKYFGVALFEHLKDQRMKQAQYLLAQTDEPVKVIAYKTGYRYAANFSAAFKKKYGSTPLQYRKLEF